MSVAEPRMIASSDCAASRWWVWLLLAMCWFATIQMRPLFDPDEGRYAEIPREMWATGDWVTPRLNGLKYFEKPPLQYWATAATYSLFGVSEWTSRLWSAVLGFLCIVASYTFVRRIYDPSHAAAAALVLATSPYFVIIGQLNLLDNAFTFFLICAVFAFLVAQRTHERSTAERRWMLLAWGSAGLAVLSKGIVALVLAGGTLVAYSITARDWQPWRRLQMRWGLPLFLIVTVPWFWLVSQRNPEFLRFFFVHEHFARFLTTVHQRAQPSWYFPVIVMLGVLPWITHLWPALRDAWQRPHDAGAMRVERFLVVWCSVVIGFFSASGSKLAPYVLPVVPALAVLLAPKIVNDLRSGARASWIVFGFILVAGTGMGAAVVRASVGASLSLIGWMAGAILIAGFATLLMSTAIVRGLGPWRFAPLALGSLLAWQGLMLSYAEQKPARTAKSLVAAIRDQVRPDTQLFSVGQYRHTAALYLGRTLRLIDYRGEFDFGLFVEDTDYIPSLPAFEEEWEHSADAVAFVDPDTFAQLRPRGLPGRVLASDSRSIVVSRR